MSKKYTVIVVLTLIMVCTVAVGSRAEMVKVARILNMLEFHGGYGQPVGSYDRIYGIPFLDSQNNLVDLDADAVYDPGYYFGFSYGQLRARHFMFSLGFRWTHVNTLDTFWIEPDWGWTYSFETPTFNQYDLDFNLNYYFFSPERTIVSPFAGLGIHAGVTSISGDTYETENETALAMGLNFGVDLNIWRSGGGRSFFALSSVNEWVIAAAAERPKYVNFGAAIKYYFRP
ncbi:MAG: hypothetical protein JSU74_06730 [Candidatus Zixiibacteriota bacterium]|nr:MAG: hypothetical protein JSU74_06730 [candidate division Zixibacteria bacterium]